MRIIFKEAEKSEDHKKYSTHAYNHLSDDPQHHLHLHHHHPQHVQRGRRRVGRSRLVLTTSHILYQSCTKILCNTYLSHDDDDGEDEKDEEDDDSNIFHV